MRERELSERVRTERKRKRRKEINGDTKQTNTQATRNEIHSRKQTIPQVADKGAKANPYVDFTVATQPFLLGHVLAVPLASGGCHANVPIHINRCTGLIHAELQVIRRELGQAEVRLEWRTFIENDRAITTLRD